MRILSGKKALQEYITDRTLTTFEHVVRAMDEAETRTPNHSLFTLLQRIKRYCPEKLEGRFESLNESDYNELLAAMRRAEAGWIGNWNQWITYLASDCDRCANAKDKLLYFRMLKGIIQEYTQGKLGGKKKQNLKKKKEIEKKKKKKELEKKKKEIEKKKKKKELEKKKKEIEKKKKKKELEKKKKKKNKIKKTKI